jgi:hypothetical protein
MIFLESVVISTVFTDQIKMESTVVVILLYYTLLASCSHSFGSPIPRRTGTSKEDLPTETAAAKTRPLFAVVSAGVSCAAERFPVSRKF